MSRFNYTIGIKNLRTWIVVLVLCFAAQLSWGQISNTRHKRIALADTIALDTLSIMPRSLELWVNGEKVDSTRYEIDILKAQLILKDSTLTVDSAEVKYRVLPAYLGKDFRNKPPTLVTEEHANSFNPYRIGVANQESIFNDNSIQKSGSISRGIMFGNSQNLSVNSTLNLQLSGKISERFHLLASITDDNIPIQPDGNTQSLQDFDQVFIQVYDDNTKLIAGDFQIRKPDGYFMNYFKRAQGAYVETKFDLPDNKTTMRVEASASVSKGRFARNTIQGVEGNQGPYRLMGADNELYIIVLAGTEQVYIDGRLLQRGQDKDYTIDYNAAEITFTPRQFITKDRRIVVEFQYSEKRYARPLLQSSITAERKNDKFYLNVFSESDAKNQPLQQDLTDQERAILTAAGDDLLKAFTSGIDSSAFNNSYVMYAMTDSLGFDSVFVYSTDSVVAKYRLSFTLVGLGNGDYVEDGFTANGKKYKWVAPVLEDGVWKRQGNYAPIRLLATPKKNQMLTAGMEKKWGKKNVSSLWVEGAISNRDLNTFSSIDSGDDVGFAFRTVYKWSQPRMKRDTLQTDEKRSFRYNNSLHSVASYEYTGQHFAPIERFREVEFSRNWNVNTINLAADQHIGGAEVGIDKKNFGTVIVGGDMLQVGSDYAGYKARLSTNILTTNNFSALVNASYLTTAGQINSDFIRHKSHIAQQFGKFRIYFKDEHEHNMQYIVTRDSVSQASYQFYDWEVGAGTADTLRKSFTVYYRDRLDRRADGNQLHAIARAEQYGALMSLRGKKDSRLSLNVSNRKLRVLDNELFTQEPENTLLTRLEYSFRIKNGFIANTSFYEVGSGLEQRKEFIYLEVPAGQGVYVWMDYNGDGIKDLNEFEVAQFSYEANYIRSFVQSNDYAKTYTNQFTNSLTITPAQILKKKEGWQKFVARFSNSSTLRIDRKTTREESSERFNPFLTSIADTSLLALNSLARNILFFNKANPKFGLDYTYQTGRNKNLLSNGFETRGDDYHQLGLRWNFYQSLTLFVDQRLGQKVASSNFMTGRNYEIDYITFEPRLTWQQSTTSRFNLIAQYAQKDNALGNELAIIQKLGADVTLNSMEKSSVQMEVNYYRIRYNGESNNSLSFDMLEGLAGGNNFTWSASIQRSVAKNLQLNLIYNGRKPEDAKTIHSGGVQVRALF